MKPCQRAAHAACDSVVGRTFSDDQLVFGPSGVGEGVVGLNELAWRQSGVVPYRIPGRRWENTVRTSVQSARIADGHSQHGDGEAMVCGSSAETAPCSTMLERRRPAQVRLDPSGEVESVVRPMFGPVRAASRERRRMNAVGA